MQSVKRTSLTFFMLWVLFRRKFCFWLSIRSNFEQQDINLYSVNDSSINHDYYFLNYVKIRLIKMRLTTRIAYQNYSSLKTNSIVMSFLYLLIIRAQVYGIGVVGIIGFRDIGWSDIYMCLCWLLLMVHTSKGAYIEI